MGCPVEQPFRVSRLEMCPAGKPDTATEVTLAGHLSPAHSLRRLRESTMASNEYIPPRLRSAFREQSRGIAVHDIKRMWQDEGFSASSGQAFSGVRMSLWSDFEAGVHWSNWGHVVKVLRVYEECIVLATSEDRQTLAGQLSRDGFRLLPSGSIEFVGTGQRITEVTRTEIIDCLRNTPGGRNWAGRMDEPEFLKRLYDLEAMPSEDPRFINAEMDVWQHRVNNDDGDFDWVFHDPRFELTSDGMLLRFLVEMLHPAVRTDPGEVSILLVGLNDALRPDGYELYQNASISGRPVYGWRSLMGFHGSAPGKLLENRHAITDPGVLQDHLDRIKRDIESDPPGAIGSCKELIESLCKLILEHSNVEYTRNDDLPKLYKKVAVLLALNAESVDDNVKGSEASHLVLRALTTSVQGIAELRNQLGLGHGRTTRSTLQPRHARLALNSTVTVTEFLLDTWHARIDSGKIPNRK